MWFIAVDGLGIKSRVCVRIAWCFWDVHVVCNLGFHWMLENMYIRIHLVSCHSYTSHVPQSPSSHASSFSTCQIVQTLFYFSRYITKTKL